MGRGDISQQRLNNRVNMDKHAKPAYIIIARISLLLEVIQDRHGPKAVDGMIMYFFDPNFYTKLFLEMFQNREDCKTLTDYIISQTKGK